jgi:diketogulonate reductase-like aldo/keto reductase
MNRADPTLGKEKGIIITAYSPLGNNFTGKPKIVDHPRIKAIADRLGKTPAQVCYAWGLHQGFCVLSKSVTPSRIKVSPSFTSFARATLRCLDADAALSPTSKTSL